MNISDLNLWSNITFKTKFYRKNFDFFSKNENIITEYQGEISFTDKERILNNKFPLLIGEYSFSVWDIDLAVLFNVDLNKLLSDNQIQNVYFELLNEINLRSFDITKYSKIVIIHSLLIHPDYRKRGVTEEFTEFIYRDFYSDKNLIIANVQPFQHNKIDLDYFLNEKTIQIRENSIVNPKFEKAKTYYRLDEFLRKDDDELSEIMLFALASKCGFDRLNNSHLFLLKQQKVLERVSLKHKTFKVKKPK